MSTWEHTFEGYNEFMHGNRFKGCNEYLRTDIWMLQRELENIHLTATKSTWEHAFKGFNEYLRTCI